MAIRITREDTVKLAREVAKLKGESLTDAIHHALEGERAEMGRARETAELEAMFAKLDAQGPRDASSLV